jgi:hypothetical protein
MIFSKTIPRLAAASLFAASLAHPACAQDNPVGWLTRLFQPPASASVPMPGDGAREWSGQSGASGDPLMTADPIRAAAAAFGNCIEGLWPAAARRGVSHELRPGDFADEYLFHESRDGFARRHDPGTCGNRLVVAPKTCQAAPISLII